MPTLSRPVAASYVFNVWARPVLHNYHSLRDFPSPESGRGDFFFITFGTARMFSSVASPRLLHTSRLRRPADRLSFAVFHGRAPIFNLHKSNAEFGFQLLPRHGSVRNSRNATSFDVAMQ